MKAIIPLAGRGTRLRPHTYTKPKPMVHVAGKPILGHVLDRLTGLPIQEIIFITGYMGDQIEEYVQSCFSYNAKYVQQLEMKGQAHAVYLAQQHISDLDDVLIVFIDTIFEADLKDLPGLEADGVIYVKEVEDPSRFGVVVVEGDQVVRLVEKPDRPVSKLVNIGLYYVKNSGLLFSSIEEQMKRNIKTKGEYYLTDAFQIMIERGARIKALPVDVWEDCGNPDTLLATNRYLLENGMSREIKTENSVIIPPVYLEDGVKVKNSVVGPYVSVAAGSEIANSIVQNSIVNRNSIVEATLCHDSIIGENVLIKGRPKKINVGDSSEVVLD